MNDNHSRHELNYKPRWIAPLLRKAIKSHPILVLTGARQVGKSTLLKYEKPFSQWDYFSLDDFEILAQAKKDPSSLFVNSINIILDEVQKSGNLLDAVKLAVDTNNRYRFVLSGSANILLMSKISESLAGRAVYFSLQPMTVGEINTLPMRNILGILFEEKFPMEKLIEDITIDPFYYMRKGFMPPLMKLDNSEVTTWWEGYVTTYLERDLRQLSQVESLPDFRRLMTALALRSGKLLNQTELSRDIGISQPTIYRYINLLESTCLLERLPAFVKNRTKRLVKAPKVIWNDPGLASFLSGYYDVESLRSSRESGGLFETMVYMHLHVMTQMLIPKPRIYYWRTTTGKEVDFVLEWGKKLIAIEVKLAEKPKYSDTENLRIFLDEYPETTACMLIYSGNEIKMLHEKIIAIPWYELVGIS